MAVYQKPSFDSEIVASLKKGKKIIVSRRKRKGLGDLGVFYKIKYGKKKYGYVTDTDLYPKKDKPFSSEKSNGGLESPYEFQDPMTENDGKLPLYFKRYIGMAYGMYNYTEKINGVTKASLTPHIGLKLSGPVLIQLPLDINIMYMMSPPSYYSNLPGGGGNTSATGFAVLSDVSFVLSLTDSEKILVTYGFGLSLSYTNFTVNMPANSPSKIPSGTVGLGVVLPVSVGYRMGKFMLKADAKYVYEEEGYFGFLGSLLYEL